MLGLKSVFNVSDFTGSIIMFVGTLQGLGNYVLTGKRTGANSSRGRSLRAAASQQEVSRKSQKQLHPVTSLIKHPPNGLFKGV